MYRHNLLDKEIVISDEAYEELVKKWKCKEIQQMSGKYRIRGNCYYCTIFEECAECPFFKFTKEFKSGCLDIIKLISPGNFPYIITTSIASWSTKEAAIACVSAVEEELRKFKQFSEVGI